MPGLTAHAAPPPPLLSPAACADGTQASGAIYRICMPSSWNGDLIVYAHGYMAPNEPVHIPEEQLHLPDGTYIPDVVNLLGYAFATTSYYTNGLAVREGLSDLVDLVSIFKTQQPTVNRVYLVGASEGGLITTLAVERYPQVFSGGLATCGPIGDFAAHVNYLVFDYFFPSLLPGTPITIPQSLIDNWSTYLAITVTPAISDPASLISVTQLLSVTQASYDPLNPTTAISTVVGLLWYNVFATNDAQAKLGGQPFDNWPRPGKPYSYTGSYDDDTLNAKVQRFSADQAALNEIEAHYQTAGRPRVPLVTLHTTLDPIVPYWHETLYRQKVESHGMTPRHDNMPPVVRYGHCSFETNEVIQALTLLQQRVANPPPFLGYLPIILKH
jgi:pimeloyl-ACP methyl ester carboxylesterase